MATEAQCTRALQGSGILLAALFLAVGLSAQDGLTRQDGVEETSPRRDAVIADADGPAESEFTLDLPDDPEWPLDDRDGDYRFLATRKTIWVFNRENGRFAAYRFLDDEESTIERSRVAQINQTTFPAEDTVFLTSDHHLTEAVWVCNARTGDVQLWSYRTGGTLGADPPVRTLDDLTPAGMSRAEAIDLLAPNSFHFLPNRRSVWVAWRRVGRFATYHFRDDQERTVERSRVAEVDAKRFPPEEAVYRLSTRNFAEAFWVCNVRTGDFLLYSPRADGRIVEGFAAAVSGVKEEILSKGVQRLEKALEERGEGAYQFLANRRTLWVVDRDAMTFQAWHFLDDPNELLAASRLVKVDQRAFPSEATRFFLSDRHFTQALWVVNSRQGRVQLWSHIGQKGLVSEAPVSTAVDLAGEAVEEDSGVAERFLFRPNRKSVWVIDLEEGRFAGYRFGGEAGENVQRTRIGELLLLDFPPDSTSYLLSDKNFEPSIWVCNEHTGDFQLWQPSAGGLLRSDKPFPTMDDLRARNVRK